MKEHEYETSQVMPHREPSGPMTKASPAVHPLGRSYCIGSETKPRTKPSEERVISRRGCPE